MCKGVGVLSPLATLINGALVSVSPVVVILLVFHIASISHIPKLSITIYNSR